MLLVAAGCARGPVTPPPVIELPQAEIPPIVVEPAASPDTTAVLITQDGKQNVDLETFNFSGEGTLEYSSGRVQRGQWRDGKLHGSGEELHNKNLYRGDWRNGVRQGQGQFIGQFGTTFEGAWENNERNGYGVATYANHVRYEGMWQDDQRSGFGQEFRPDGSSYRGEWQAGKRHGSGLEQHPNGSSYEGAWSDDHALGNGTVTQRSGIRLSGLWTQSRIRDGLVELPDGNQYAGEIYQSEGLLSEDLLQWLKARAADNSVYAQYWLGTAYADGSAGTKNDQLASTWLSRSAEGGLADAQYRVAVRSFDQDWPTSEQYLQSAAEQGHARAHTTLGEFYHQGHHTPKNLEQAIYHYEQAIEKGHLTATNNLAWLLGTTSTNWADAERAAQLLRPLVLYVNSWQLLDTFAAIQARLNQFELAARLQAQAVQAAQQELGDNPEVGAMEARLALYEQGLPYTE